MRRRVDRIGFCADARQRLWLFVLRCKTRRILLTMVFAGWQIALPYTLLFCFADPVTSATCSLVVVTYIVICFQTTIDLRKVLDTTLNTQGITKIEIMEITSFSSPKRIILDEPQKATDFLAELYAIKLHNRLTIPDAWTLTPYRNYEITLVDDQRMIAVLMFGENFVIATSITNFSRKSFTLIHPDSAYTCFQAWSKDG